LVAGKRLCLENETRQCRGCATQVFLQESKAISGVELKNGVPEEFRKERLRRLRLNATDLPFDVVMGLF